MKIKFELLLVFIVILPHYLFSQVSKNDTLSRAVGIDANFINTFLPLDNPIGSRGKYLLHYIKYKPDGKITRHALNLDLTGTFEKNESDFDKNDAQFDLDYKISKGKVKNVFKNDAGYILFGGELSADYFYNKRSNIDPTDPSGESWNTSTDQIYAAGFGPFIGFGYQIFKRVSIYTEAGVSLRLSYGFDKFTSGLDSSDNFKDKKFTISTRYVLPSSIILFYHF